MSLEYQKLGDVADFIRGITYKPNDLVDNFSEGSTVCMRTANVQVQLKQDDLLSVPANLVKNKDKFLIEGDILVSTANSWNLVGKCCWIPKLEYSATAGGFISILRANQEKLDQRYLYHWFNSPNTQLLARNCGRQTTNISNMDLDRCLSIKIPLPPLAEQRRIASILDQAHELRQKRQQTIEKLDQLLQATFIDMFGDPVSNPKGWDLKSVGEISESKLGKMLDKKKQSSENDQYKYLRNANVQWFRFDLSDVFEMEFNEKDRKNCELKFGDILVCEGGEPGRAAIWKNNLENCFFQKALHRVRLDMTQILPEYFVWLFWFYSKNGGFDDHITVATIAHLTGIKMKAMQIPIPPLSLQEEFQQKVNEIEVLKTTLENSSKLFESLFSSLQNQAFNGTL
ncbi:restriction endonuclease subunit S [Acinetobacter johnsonii]|uniref:restriction endonuclease subunit S n=1 Tax=Acinetobacter johnsonii TaxID=40214 RepID=UPI001F1760DB|nr:restriction endonuclease subunit S [Acinetobacter johnsonii]UJA00508.1 restriction endonuclease [Acinetobacter johnsonii]